MRGFLPLTMSFLQDCPRADTQGKCQRTVKLSNADSAGDAASFAREAEQLE